MQPHNSRISHYFSCSSRLSSINVRYKSHLICFKVSKQNYASFCKIYPPACIYNFQTHILRFRNSCSAPQTIILGENVVNFLLGFSSSIASGFIFVFFTIWKSNWNSLDTSSMDTLSTWWCSSIFVIAVQLLCSFCYTFFVFTYCKSLAYITHEQVSCWMPIIIHNVQSLIYSRTSL